MQNPGDITQLLQQWSNGDAAAGSALTPLVYEQLQHTARRLFRAESGGHTLQPTALVHEAFVRLVDADVDWQDRAHFFALAARMMRRLLVDHAKSRRAKKRGGDDMKITLHEDRFGSLGCDDELLALHEAIERLAAVDARKAELIELQYFGGLSFQELEAVTGLSSSTIDRHLRLARAWLKSALQ